VTLVRRAGPAVALGFLVGGALFAAPLVDRAPEARFPHEKHARVFPLCTTCHAGVVEPGQPMWPEPIRCASCHNGVVKPRVTWEPRVGPRPGNRRFTHQNHDRAVSVRNPADSALIRNCSACHNQAGTPRMAVRNAVVGQCLSCHGLKEPHVDVPSQACATCHVRLTDAPGLTRADIARFPRPSSHDAPDFRLGGHGRLARVVGRAAGEIGIAASCATCHSRNLCIACHVNAPESPVIAALAFDERAPAYATSQPKPPSHAAPGFLRAHGREAQRSTATCAVCHARESCASCHIGVPPRAIAALPAAGPGRAAGALLTRAKPSSHTRDFKERHGAQANARPMACASCHARESCASCHIGAVPRAVAAMPPAATGRAVAAQWTRTPPSTHTRDWRERHGAEASARPASCETCHVRSTCLECHRPDVARQSRYHPQNFLTRHPSSAYSREANCSDCHNPAQFCQSCHQQAGLVAAGRIGTTGYHDAFRGFSLGHGQAARQSLESCASCHAERDCTACHSAVGGGFRFSPHGPGFNAARIRSKNPSVCIACHGRAIPEAR
jgi:hypothetical protein